MVENRVTSRSSVTSVNVDVWKVCTGGKAFQVSAHNMMKSFLWVGKKLISKQHKQSVFKNNLHCIREWGGGGGEEKRFKACVKGR